MGGEGEGEALHFTLHLDKPLACQVEIASWNPEKDLLAMVSADHQLTVHRFNWQRLWAISPEKKVTSICWRPDGKALAVGHEDGEISLHDVENGEILRKIETHSASIQCLCWVEERAARFQDSALLHEDRTSRFFPQPPKAPAMPGTGSAFDMVGGLGSGDDQDSARQNAGSKQSQQYLNILCSTDGDGVVCLNAFGMFAIGNLNLRSIFGTFQRPSSVKVILSSNLCSMILLCHDSTHERTGLSSSSIDTSLLSSRRNEIRQVALQASSVEELLDVLRATLTVMIKHWGDAINAFNEKFNAFHTLLREHGSQSTARDELLSLLACGSASAPLHQFLATVGEGGLKRLAKSIDAAGRELHILIAEHLQPAAEIVAFRIGELLGLSRWRNQLQSIGLDESLVDGVMENAGMFLVQVERFLHIVSETLGRFRVFFVWLTKSLRQLNGEGTLLQVEQASAVNSSQIAAFLNSEFESDPIGPHLASEGVMSVTGFEEEQSKAEDLLLLGGFKDVNFLRRTLFQQFNMLCDSWRTTFSKPVAVISPGLTLRREHFLWKFPAAVSKPPAALSSTFYETKRADPVCQHPVDYTCFQMSSDKIGVVRGFGLVSDGAEVVILQLERTFTCVDFALYKEKQLVLLISQNIGEDDHQQAWIMVLQLEELPFTAFTASNETSACLLQHCESNDAVVPLSLDAGKSRRIPQLDVIPPLAVSASRGLACVFASQRRALLYDLEEDEEEKDTEAEAS